MPWNPSIHQTDVRERPTSVSSRLHAGLGGRGVALAGEGKAQFNAENLVLRFFWGGILKFWRENLPSLQACI